MNEIKNPKRPLVYYAVVAMLAVLLFNLLAVPAMANAAVKEVDYGTFVPFTSTRTAVSSSSAAPTSALSTSSTPPRRPLRH